MENKKNSNALWIVLAVLVAAVIALGLIIRTEKRLLRLMGKVDKVLPLKKKSDPIKVEL